LADDQNAAADFQHAPVHHALIIRENAQAHNLAAEPFDVLGTIGLLDSQQYKQAFSIRLFTVF
jgi:hypothetical protein